MYLLFIESIGILFEKNISYRLSEKWLKGQYGMRFCLVLTLQTDLVTVKSWYLSWKYLVTMVTLY